MKRPLDESSENQGPSAELSLISGFVTLDGLETLSGSCLPHL